jgi:hypothetical protein
MRTLLVDRWYVGPIVAIIALMVCAAWEADRRASVGSAKFNEAVRRIYSMAMQRDFAELRKSGLLSEPSLHYLERQDSLFGPVVSWNSAETDSGQLVRVDRRGFHSEDLVYSDAVAFGQDYSPSSLMVLPAEVETSDQFVAARTKAEALAMARDYIHHHDSASMVVRKIEATRKGNDWLVEERGEIDGKTVKWFLTLPVKGGPIERYRDVGFANPP